MTHLFSSERTAQYVYRVLMSNNIPVQCPCLMWYHRTILAETQENSKILPKQYIIDSMETAVLDVREENVSFFRFLVVLTFHSSLLEYDYEAETRLQVSILPDKQAKADLCSHS